MKSTLYEKNNLTTTYSLGDTGVGYSSPPYDQAFIILHGTIIIFICMNFLLAYPTAGSLQFQVLRGCEGSLETYGGEITVDFCIVGKLLHSPCDNNLTLVCFHVLNDRPCADTGSAHHITHQKVNNT